MRNRSGQTLLEYTVLVVILIGAFVATSTYIKRGIQGRWKSAVDDLGEQYDPLLMTTDITYSINGTSKTVIDAVPGSYGGVDGIWTIRTDSSNMTEQKSGSSQSAAE